MYGRLWTREKSLIPGFAFLFSRKAADTLSDVVSVPQRSDPRIAVSAGVSHSISAPPVGLRRLAFP